MRGVFTDLTNADPVWVGLAIFYIVFSVAACIIIYRWYRSTQMRQNTFDKRLSDQEDLTKPLAYSKKMRMMNEGKNGHHTDLKKTGT